MAMTRPRILVVNPNSTASFTTGIVKSLEPLASLVEVTGVTIADAPAAINSTRTSIESTSAALEQLRADPGLQHADGALALPLDRVDSHVDPRHRRRLLLRSPARSPPP
jgi:hypothetical protein